MLGEARQSRPTAQHRWAAPGQAARTDLSAFAGRAQRRAQGPARSTPAPAAPASPGSPQRPAPGPRRRLPRGNPACAAGPAPARAHLRRHPPPVPPRPAPGGRSEPAPAAAPAPTARASSSRRRSRPGPARPLPTLRSRRPPRPPRHAAHADWLPPQHVLGAAANQQLSRGPPARSARVSRDPRRPRGSPAGLVAAPPGDTSAIARSGGGKVAALPRAEEPGRSEVPPRHWPPRRRQPRAATRGARGRSRGGRREGRGGHAPSECRHIALRDWLTGAGGRGQWPAAACEGAPRAAGRGGGEGGLRAALGLLKFLLCESGISVNCCGREGWNGGVALGGARRGRGECGAARSPVARWLHGKVSRPDFCPWFLRCFYLMNG